MNSKLNLGILTLLIIVLFPATSVGQQRLLQGRVTTFDSIPLMKANIEVASTKKVTQTDSLGYFQVFCNDQDRIAVSARGFAKEKVKVDVNNTFLMVNMKLKNGDYNRELAVGYGHIKNADKLFAVSTLGENEVDYSRFPTLERAIVGRFPGVVVRNNEVIVRGNESFSAGNGALIVIDGIAKGYSIAGIAPYNVKKISILKDASAAAYGSRGANGVVLIETKRGEEN